MSQAGHCEEDIYLMPLLEFKLQFFQPVANIFTTLSWLLVTSGGNVLCSTIFMLGRVY
jgi:hypothetical protein